MLIKHFEPGPRLKFAIRANIERTASGAERFETNYSKSTLGWVFYMQMTITTQYIGQKSWVQHPRPPSGSYTMASDLIVHV